MIDDGRLTFPGKESRTTKHAMPCCRRRENTGLPLPMNHILACYMGKRVPFVLIDIMKVINTSIMDGTVRICGYGLVWTGMRKMVRKPRAWQALRHDGSVDAFQFCKQGLRRLRSAVLKVTIELPPAHDSVDRGLAISQGYRLDFACGQGTVIESHIVDAALEKLTLPHVRADIRRGFTLRVNRPGGRLDANFLTVCVERDCLAIKRHADQVPFSVEQLGRLKRHAMVDVLPTDPQAEAETVLLLVITNRHEGSGIAIFFPVNRLPIPLAFADSLRFDPRGDRDRLGRFKPGVVRDLDGDRVAAEGQRLAEFAVRIFVSCSRIDDCEKQEGKRREDRHVSFQDVHVSVIELVINVSGELDLLRRRQAGRSHSKTTPMFFRLRCMTFM